MLGLGFIGTLLVLGIAYYYWNKTSEDNKFLTQDAVDRTAEITLCGIHKGLDEAENIISSGKGLQKYKAELVARRLAARNKKDIA